MKKSGHDQTSKYVGIIIKHTYIYDWSPGVPKPGLIHMRFVYIVIWCYARTCYCRCLFCAFSLVVFPVMHNWLGSYVRYFYSKVLWLFSTLCVSLDHTYFYVLVPARVIYSVFLWETPIAMWGFPFGAPIGFSLIDTMSYFRCFSEPHGAGDMFNVSLNRIHCYMCLAVPYPLCVARGSNATAGVALNIMCGFHIQCQSDQTELMCMACGSHVSSLSTMYLYKWFIVEFVLVGCHCFQYVLACIAPECCGFGLGSCMLDDTNNVWCFINNHIKFVFFELFKQCNAENTQFAQFMWIDMTRECITMTDSYVSYTNCLVLIHMHVWGHTFIVDQQFSNICDIVFTNIMYVTRTFVFVSWTCKFMLLHWF